MARLASRRIRQLVLNVFIVVDGVHGEIGKKRTGWPESGRIQPAAGSGETGLGVRKADAFGHDAYAIVLPRMVSSIAMACSESPSLHR